MVARFCAPNWPHVSKSLNFKHLEKLDPWRQLAPQLHFTLAGNEVLKISIVESTGEAVMLQLEGQISGKWVDLLQLTTEEYLYREARLFLDLSKVRFVDRGGIALLQKLVGHQVAVLNASPFIAQEIAAAP